MQKDEIDFTLLQQEASRGTEVKLVKGKIKNRILDLIRGPTIQLVVCSLVLLDALIVTAEIMLEMHAVKAEKRIFESNQSEWKHQLYRYYCTSHTNPKSIYSSATLDECCQRPFNYSGVAYKAMSPPFSLCCPARGSSDCSGVGEGESTQLFTVFRSVSSPPLNQVNARCSHLNCCLNQLNNLVQYLQETSGNFGSCYFFYSMACLLHMLSISILCIFVIQLAVKVLCMGPAFFRLKFEVVDGIIILISLIADAIFVYIASDEITLIIVFLIWRIVRVVNSLMMYEKQRNEFRIQLQKRARRISEVKVGTLLGKIAILKKHIESLKRVCMESGVPRERLIFCRPLIAKSGEEVTKNAIRSMALRTSEIITQVAVGGTTKPSDTMMNRCLDDQTNTAPKCVYTATSSADCTPLKGDSCMESSNDVSPPGSPPIWTKLKPV